MEDEGKPGGEGGRPQEPQQATSQEPQAGEGAKPQELAGGEGAVNRHQYERDIERRDKEIAALREQLAASVKGAKSDAERIADLEAKFEAAERARAEEADNARLAAAGCVNNKAAKALLPDYGGDVAKLKGECPYLFSRPRELSTGGAPAPGASGGQAKTIKEALKQRG